MVSVDADQRRVKANRAFEKRNQGTCEGTPEMARTRPPRYGPMLRQRSDLNKSGLRGWATT